MCGAGPSTVHYIIFLPIKEHEGAPVYRLDERAEAATVKGEDDSCSERERNRLAVGRMDGKGAKVRKNKIQATLVGHSHTLKTNCR